MGEQIFFSGGDVQVTRTRVIVGNQTYPVNGITSIRTAHIPPNRLGSVLAGILGLLVLFTSQGNLQNIIFGLVLIGVAVLLWIKAKHTYSIFFGTAGGEKQALSSADADYVNRVAGAVDEALIARG